MHRVVEEARVLLAAALLWGLPVLLSGIASRLLCVWYPLLADPSTHLATCGILSWVTHIPILPPVCLGCCPAVWTLTVGRLLSVLQYNAHSGCH